MACVYWHSTRRIGGVMQRVLRGVMSVLGRSEEDLATLSRRRGEACVGERLDKDVQSELTPQGEGKFR